MNARLLFKTLFLIFLLLFLVLMGMNNLKSVDFYMRPVLPDKVSLPSALMYYAFFAIGVITGTIMNAGNSGGKKSGGKNKVDS